MGLPGCSIPEGELPQCWSDDVRMNALFAPFRIKTTNPESWDMKMKFWSDMLRQWCRHKKNPVVSAADAKAAFCRKGRTPACLDIVVEEMFHNGDLCPLSKYQQILHSGPEGWVKWGARIAFKPAAFALTAVASFLPSRQSLDNDGLPKASIDCTQRFVLESAVKEQAMDLLQNFPSEDRIGTVEELMKTCDWNQSRETFELLLGYLVSQGYAIKKDLVVKLAEPDKKASPVSESDEAMVKLLTAARKLQNDADRLTRDVATAHHDAATALKLGNKLGAKNHLRRKHKTQQRLDRCTAALDNVTHLLQQLRDAHVNVAIVDTYRTSSEAMKQNMKENGMTEDAVHDTMDDLKEVMDSYSEVEKALGSTVEDFDAAELEEELKELLASPGAPGGGTPGKDEKRESKLSPSPWKAGRKVSEREFVFDGEARMLAELNQLDIDDSAPDSRDLPDRPTAEEVKPPVVEKKKVAVAEAEIVAPSTPTKPSTPKANKPSKAWYPPSGEWSQTKPWTNNNNDCTLADIAGGFGELHLDERLHPGQKLTMDFTSPPRLYNTDFQVQDHKMSAGVWLYNSRDKNSNVDSDLAHSTEYFSSESPGKSSSGFQMAPGGERRRSSQESWPLEGVEDLERRLKNLRDSEKRAKQRGYTHHAPAAVRDMFRSYTEHHQEYDNFTI